MLIIHMTIIILVLVTWCTLCLVIEAKIAKLLNIKIPAKCTVYMVFSCYAIHALLNRLIMLIISCNVLYPIQNTCWTFVLNGHDNNQMSNLILLEGEHAYLHLNTFGK